MSTVTVVNSCETCQSCLIDMLKYSCCLNIGPEIKSMCLKNIHVV